MTRKKSLLAALFLVFFWTSLSGAANEPKAKEGKDGEEDLITVRTPEGLYFKVPPDMPIVKRNGTVGPIPMEEYLHRKIRALNKQIEDLTKKVEELSKRVEHIEKEEPSASLVTKPPTP